jgi:hypothetical protein
MVLEKHPPVAEEKSDVGNLDDFADQDLDDEEQDSDKEEVEQEVPEQSSDEEFEQEWSDDDDNQTSSAMSTGDAAPTGMVMPKNDHPPPTPRYPAQEGPEDNDDDYPTTADSSQRTSDSEDELTVQSLSDGSDTDTNTTRTTQSSRSSRSSRSTDTSRSSRSSGTSQSSRSSGTSQSSRSESSRTSDDTSPPSDDEQERNSTELSEEAHVPNACGFKSVRCLGAQELVDAKRAPYVAYRLEVRDGDGKRWQVARRFSEFCDFRASMQRSNIVEDATARNTIEQVSNHASAPTKLVRTSTPSVFTIRDAQLPFPAKVGVMTNKTAPDLVHTRAGGLHRWIRGALRWAPRGAVTSFLYNDGSDNLLVDVLASQTFMVSSTRVSAHNAQYCSTADCVRYHVRRRGPRRLGCAGTSHSLSGIAARARKIPSKSKARAARQTSY